MKIFLLCILCLCVGLFSGVVIGSHKGKPRTRQYRGGKKKASAAYRIRQKKKRLAKEITNAPSDEQMKGWAEKGLRTH